MCFEEGLIVVDSWNLLSTNTQQTCQPESSSMHDVRRKYPTTKTDRATERKRYDDVTYDASDIIKNRHG